jgi:acylphosphatase
MNKEVLTKMVRKRLKIKGRVQGVFFRDSTQRKALSLGLSGWVKNMPDRSVQALVEGPEEKVAELISWCHQGPPAADVKEVIQEDEEYKGNLSLFEIHY